VKGHVQITRPVRRWFPRSVDEVRGPFDRGNLWRWILGVLVGAFVFGFLLVALVFFPGFGRSTIVTVPELRGKQAAAAERAVERFGLKLVRGQRLMNPTVPAGAVLVQSPLAGQEVTRGAEVRVVLSAGPERRPVPPIGGLSLRDAQALLVRHGFTVHLRRVQNDANEGAILGIHPATGTRAVVPSVVTLFISAGPPKMVVPDVVTLPIGEAQTRLQAVGLRLGSVSYDSASTAVLGGIVRQRPAAGDSLARGRGVSVTVSGRDPRPPLPVDSAGPADTTAAPPPQEETPPAENPPPAQPPR
jgi:beta-lactam-binding protein with PASTA domain